ncbi:hypothetical protein MRX96_000085 [Rhipicephalus microplus]|uniref:Myosin motor domain-containing protein n=1 Tax=Rhipicephalus microplus TaxID=6941 RepID=A0A9J6E253_RHIMP|nr:hypothetical protein HPB51_016169 [Rhipicephalus microplus]
MSHVNASFLLSVDCHDPGLPHRMRFKAFNVRYRLLAPFKILKKTDDKAVGDCKLILEHFSQTIANVKLSNATVNWALGKRHIFLSENARQQLELLREARRHAAALLIQAVWRGWHQRLRWPSLRRSLQLHGRVANTRCALLFLTEKVTRFVRRYSQKFY